MTHNVAQSEAAHSELTEHQDDVLDVDAAVRLEVRAAQRVPSAHSIRRRQRAAGHVKLREQQQQILCVDAEVIRQVRAALSVHSASTLTELKCNLT